MATMSEAEGELKEIEALPEQLAAATPMPLTLQPAAVYLSQLAPRSRRTMRQALNSVASLLTGGAVRCDDPGLVEAALPTYGGAALGVDGEVRPGDG